MGNTESRPVNINIHLQFNGAAAARVLAPGTGPDGGAAAAPLGGAAAAPLGENENLSETVRALAARVVALETALACVQASLRP